MKKILELYKNYIKKLLSVPLSNIILSMTIWIQTLCRMAYSESFCSLT